MINLTVSEVADIPHPPPGTSAAAREVERKGWVTGMLPTRDSGNAAIKLHDRFEAANHVAPAKLVVAAGAEWFQVAGRARVALETRVPLRRLLLALAEMKAADKNKVLPVTAAFEAGWPGERANPTAAAMRVYTAVHSLRRLGLRGLLVRRRRGYVLDIDVQIANESQFPPAMSIDEAAEAGCIDEAEMAHSA